MNRGKKDLDAVIAHLIALDALDVPMSELEALAGFVALRLDTWDGGRRRVFWKRIGGRLRLRVERVR